MSGLTIKKTGHPVYRTDNDIDIIKNEDEIAMTEKMKGSFTLPGESGYEDLTLKMAKKWGADVIRDSDGTQLSPEILEAGYDIYSTIYYIAIYAAAIIVYLLYISKLEKLKYALYVLLAIILVFQIASALSGSLFGIGILILVSIFAINLFLQNQEKGEKTE